MSMENALYLFKKTTMYTKFWNYEFCFLKIPCHITAIFHFEEKNILENLTHFMLLVSLYIPRKHQRTSSSLMFSGVQKEISGMKWVNSLNVCSLAAR